MARQTNSAKAIEWQARLRRFEACDLTVARFCARERVTAPTFWYWRRRCAESNVAGASTFAPVDVIGGRLVTCRFPTGVVVEIPEDCPDLVRVTIETLSGASQSC